MLFRITYSRVLYAEIDLPTIEEAAQHAKTVVKQFSQDEVKVLSIRAPEGASPAPTPKPYTRGEMRDLGLRTSIDNLLPPSAA